MGSIFSEVGERIKRAREERGWTQAQLAAAVGYSDATIGNYESGRRGVGLDDLYKIAAALNKPFGYFVGAEEVASENVRRQVETEIRRDMAGFVGVRLLPVVSDPAATPLLDDGNIRATIPVAREMAADAGFLVEVPAANGSADYWFCTTKPVASGHAAVVATVAGEEFPRVLQLRDGGYWPVDAADMLQAWLPSEITVHASVLARYLTVQALKQGRQRSGDATSLLEATEGLAEEELADVLQYVHFLKSKRIV